MHISVSDDKKKFVKYNWDEYAKRAKEPRDIVSEYKYLVEFMNNVKPRGKVLDIGCGSALSVTSFLKNKGYEITAIDISPEQVKKARLSLPMVNFVEMDMEDLKFDEAEFDAVVCLFAIQYTDRLYHQKTLRSMFNVLKPGGTLLITMAVDPYEGVVDLYEDIKMYSSQYGMETNLGIVAASGFNVLYKDVYQKLGKKHLLIIAKKPITASLGKSPYKKVGIIYEAGKGTNPIDLYVKI